MKILTILKKYILKVVFFNFKSIKFLCIVLIFYIFCTGFQINSKIRNSCKSLAFIDTEYGRITFRFLEDVAPWHVEQVEKLVRSGFYNDSCHFGRVIKDSFAEINCNSKNVEKIKSIDAEFSVKYTHKKGVISMSRGQDVNSANWKFFITMSDAPYLDNQYTIFGYVVDGIDVLDKLKITQKAKKNENLIYKIISSCDDKSVRKID